MSDITIKDYDLERLEKSDKLFNPESIKTVLNRQTREELVFLTIWEAAHQTLTNEDCYFFKTFPDLLKINSINLDGTSRHEAITIYKQEPRIQLSNEDENEEKPKKSLLSLVLGI
jgi:hypothetical protein